jgi:hypothetical protein
MTGQRQLAETSAMLLIGDGVLGMLRPSAHCAVWRTGHPRWDSAVAWFSRRPALVRACATIELAVGIWLADRHLPRSTQINKADSNQSHVS